MTTTWWGITILCVVCVAVWILLSALLYRQFFKRFYDIVLSMIAIMVFSPLLLVLMIVGAIAMKGNPFFVQKRPGRRKKLSRKECEKRGVPYGTYGEERIIRLIKLRTMTNEKDEQGNLLPDEKRLTKYGKFLRSTSLDELFSLFNIFVGDISIVGPRPLLVKYLPYYNEKEKHRHDIRPGLTGMAQVNGRNYLSWEETFEYDLFYVEHYTFFIDLKIFFQTIGKVIKRDGITEQTEGSGVDKNGKYVYDTFDVERTKQRLISKNRAEIGSDFFNYSLIKSKHCSSIGLPNMKHIEFYSSGRNAIRAICKTISLDKKTALLPEYTCYTIIDSFILEGFAVYFYSVNRNMMIDIASLQECINQYDPKVVFVQAYFGFNTLQNLRDSIEAIKNRGICIIEDITHSQYSLFEHISADFYVASLRKFFAITDGGYLQTNQLIQFPQNKPTDKQIIDLYMSACNLKRRYIDYLDTNIEKTVYREKYKEYNNLLDENRDEIASMSDIAFSMINNVDLDAMGKIRRENYRYLFNKIANFSNVIKPVFDSCITDNCVPIYFPIYVCDSEKRSVLQEALAQHLIYCPIIWPMSTHIDKVSSESDYIYKHILCIPIDQRYDVDDMQRIIDTLEKNIGEVLHQ